MKELPGLGPAAPGLFAEGKTRSSKRDFLVFISGVFLLKLLYSALVDLTPDEAYYWTWAKHLDLSYYDHPPMVAYIIYLTTLFGYLDSTVMVRFGAVVMGTGVSIVVYLMATSVFRSSRAGFWAVIWLNLSLLFSLGASIITPDTPQAFFSMLFIYFFYRTLFDPLRGGLYLSGVFLGLSLLSKYSAFLFVPSALLFLLLSSGHRPLLFQKEIYLMFFISFVIFSPVLLWNYQYQWISFKFQLAHGLAENDYNSFRGFLELLGTQLLLITPFLYFLLSITAYYCGKEGLVKKEPVFLYLFCMSVPTLLFFFGISFHSRIEGNWPSQGYLALIVVSGGVTAGFQRIFNSEKKRRLFGRLKLTSVVSASVILVMVHLVTIVPPAIILKKTTLAKRIVGWKDLGEKLTELIEKNYSASTFVLTNSHQTSSEINFYTEGRFEAFQTGEHYRYPYLKSSLQRYYGKDALYITEKREENSILHVKKFFKSAEELEPVSIYIRGERVKIYKVYRCINYEGGFI